MMPPAVAPSLESGSFRERSSAARRPTTSVIDSSTVAPSVSTDSFMYSASHGEDENWTR